MNALDRAFIKAFAKDQPATSGERTSAATIARQQPPTKGVESTSLELPALTTQGRRLRVDRPESPEPVFLVPHMIMPMVEHRESYDPAEIGESTVERVWIDDRTPTRESLTSLAGPARGRPASESVSPDAAASHVGTGRATSEADDHAKPLVLWAQPMVCRPDLETSVTAHPSLSLGSSAVAQGCATILEIAQFDLDAALLASAEPAEVGEAGNAAADQPLPGVPLESLRPVWEVDAFSWPEVVLRLDEASGGQLSQAGEELCAAVRDGLQVVAVSSATRGEGRTTVALALARCAAQAGSRVALLDADGRHPDLARQLGVEAPCDWYESLHAGERLCEAAVASVADRVTLFPLTAPHPHLSGRLDTGSLGAALRELKHGFDLVVVDAPWFTRGAWQAEGVPDPGEVDMAVLVRDAQQTSHDDTLAAVAGLRDMGIRAVGIVENFSPEDASGA